MPRDPESLARQRYWGTRIRELREDRHLSGYRLARMAKITPPYLAALEAGEHSPGDGVRERLATALEVAVPDIFPSPIPAGVESGRAAS